MNQNTSVDNDLQKAIDDITKSTSSDPLFSDPVAAPAPAPAPVGPFPVATPAPAPAPMPEPAPMRMAPAPAPAPMPEPMPAPEPMPMPEPVRPAEPVSAPVEDIQPAPIDHEEDYYEPTPKTPFMERGNLGIRQVKEAALRELAPILSKLDVPAEQKFDIYRNVLDNYHDSSVIEPAYYAASEIKDDRDRGEALLYIIDSIDKM